MAYRNAINFCALNLCSAILLTSLTSFIIFIFDFLCRQSWPRKMSVLCPPFQTYLFLYFFLWFYFGQHFKYNANLVTSFYGSWNKSKDFQRCHHFLSRLLCCTRWPRVLLVPPGGPNHSWWRERQVKHQA